MEINKTYFISANFCDIELPRLEIADAVVCPADFKVSEVFL